jgi:hypothetical protein
MPDRRIDWHDGSPTWFRTSAAVGDYRAGLVKVAKSTDARMGEALMCLFWNDRLVATNSRFVWPEKDMMDLIDRHRGVLIDHIMTHENADLPSPADDPAWGAF